MGLTPLIGDHRDTILSVTNETVKLKGLVGTQIPIIASFRHSVPLQKLCKPPDNVCLQVQIRFIKSHAFVEILQIVRNVRMLMINGSYSWI